MVYFIFKNLEYFSCYKSKSEWNRIISNKGFKEMTYFTSSPNNNLRWYFQLFRKK
jgi:hypothetical protein